MAKLRARAGKMESKRCVFCKYWDDPSWSEIKQIAAGIWEYEGTGRRRCSVKNGFFTLSVGTCPKFTSKL